MGQRPWQRKRRVLVADHGGVRLYMPNSLVWMLCAPDVQVFSVVEEMSRVKAYLRPCVGGGNGGAFGVVFLLEGVVGVLFFLST